MDAQGPFVSCPFAHDGLWRFALDGVIVSSSAASHKKHESFAVHFLIPLHLIAFWVASNDLKLCFEARGIHRPWRRSVESGWDVAPWTMEQFLSLPCQCSCIDVIIIGFV